MTQAGFDDDARSPRRVPLRRSRKLRLVSLAFALVSAAAVHHTASAHLGVVDALWLALAALAALGISFLRYERRQPAFVELTAEGVGAFDVTGRLMFQGRIVGFTQWAERLLVLAVAGADARRADTIVVSADSIDAATFRALAVRGRHATY